MKTLKFLFFVMFPFLLLSCEMYDKLKLRSLVERMQDYNCNWAEPCREWKLDSVVYMGNEKRIHYCFSYRDLEDWKELRAEREKELMDYYKYYRLMELHNDSIQKELLPYMSHADFDLQYSYLDPKGKVLLEWVFSKDEYNRTEQEVKNLYSDILVEPDLKDLQSRLPEIQNDEHYVYDERFVLDSLSYDLSERKAFFFMTVHDLNLEGGNKDSFFVLVKDALIEEQFLHYYSMALCDFDWTYVYHYKMDGKPLYELSVSADDVAFYLAEHMGRID